MNVRKEPYIWKYKGKGTIWINDNLEDLITSVARHEALDPFDNAVRTFYKQQIIRQMCQEDPGLCTRSGLGDLVHLFAMPVAAMLDAVFGTRLKDCQGCSRRRALLNRIKL
jgi:hypothetical protein